MTLGFYDATGASPADLGSSDVVRLDVVDAADLPLLVPKVVVLLDGQGSVVADVTLQVTLEDPSANVLAVSAPVVVASGSDAAWVDFVFPDAASLEAGAGLYVASIAATVGALASARSWTVAPPYGGSHNVAGYAPAFTPYAVNPGSTGFEVARLPFAIAQAGLATPGRLAPPSFTTLGWHGQALDPRMGSYALARADGPLAGAAGRIVRVTPRDRSRGDAVYAFVLNDTAILSNPVTVTRRLFVAMAMAWEEDVDVQVEVVA